LTVGEAAFCCVCFVQRSVQGRGPAKTCQALADSIRGQGGIWYLICPADCVPEPLISIFLQE
jgi:hypothetical protein